VKERKVGVGQCGSVTVNAKYKSTLVEGEKMARPYLDDAGGFHFMLTTVGLIGLCRSDRLRFLILFYGNLSDLLWRWIHELIRATAAGRSKTCTRLSQHTTQWKNATKPRKVTKQLGTNAAMRDTGTRTHIRNAHHGSGRRERCSGQRSAAQYSEASAGSGRKQAVGLVVPAA